MSLQNNLGENDINADKIAYLLGLLGRNKKVEQESDSEFEDIEDQEVYKMIASERLRKIPVVDDILISDTTVLQSDVETVVGGIYQEILDDERDPGDFNFSLHEKYFKRSLFVPLPDYYKSLDANHGWMLYWLINFHLLFNTDGISDDISKLVSEKINTLIIEDGLGGIGGGLNQLGHAASAYASVLCLTLIKDYETLDRIRPNIYKWLFETLRNGDGSFLMHNDGETDVRSTYCVLVIASLLNIVTDELVENTATWISKCQTFEGGFAGIPLAEAHGGYTFCAVASYFLLMGKKEGELKDNLNDLFDVENLLRWVSLRQYNLEGGLSGRTNKLVDACYSFWIGGVFPILEMITGEESLFDRDALKCYILNCCQDSRGGLRDKPGKHPDFYHLNYTTLGLCITENNFKLDNKAEEDVHSLREVDFYAYRIKTIAIEDSKLCGINPIFGLPIGVAERCKEHFVQLDENR